MDHVSMATFKEIVQEPLNIEVKKEWSREKLEQFYQIVIMWAYQDDFLYELRQFVKRELTEEEQYIPKETMQEFLELLEADLREEGFTLDEEIGAE